MRIVPTRTERAAQFTSTRRRTTVTAPHPWLRLQSLAGNAAVAQQVAGIHAGGPRFAGVLQRQKDPTARARVQEAMEKLKTRFGLADVLEENGATWTVAELSTVDTAFGKVRTEDQRFLKDLYLVRTDKFESVVRHGKTIKVAGETHGIGTIKFNKDTFAGNATQTILHEVGHLINNKVAEAMLEKSRPKLELDAARAIMTGSQQKAPSRGLSPELREFVQALGRLTTAAVGLQDNMYGRPEVLAAKEAALNEANVAADMAVGGLPTNDKSVAAWLEVYNKQEKWIQAVRNYIAERNKRNLTSFIDLVTKNNFARKRYVPFTDYVASSWPDMPWEFFAESFSTWRNNPTYLKNNMKPLFEWFEKGGHLESKGFLEGKGLLEITRETAPVIYELGREVAETFQIPALRDAVRGAK